VVDELLAHGADANQPLTHGLGNALCVATLPVCELNRSPASRIALVCSRPVVVLLGGIALAVQAIPPIPTH